MLTRWNNTSWPAPWFGDPRHDAGTFTELRRHMDRMFEELDRRLPLATHERPRFSLEDTGDALEVRAEVPGFRTEELDVQIERSTLTIRGRRSVETPEGFVAHHRERGSMEIARALTLPARVDADRVSATLEHGVLTLRLPKLADQAPRRVEIEVVGEGA